MHRLESLTSAEPDLRTGGDTSQSTGGLTLSTGGFNRCTVEVDPWPPLRCMDPDFIGTGHPRPVKVPVGLIKTPVKLNGARLKLTRDPTLRCMDPDFSLDG